MEILQGVWKQHLRPRAVVGYGIKIILPSPPNYVTRSPGGSARIHENNPDMESAGLHFRHSYLERANAYPNKQFLAIIES